MRDNYIILGVPRLYAGFCAIICAFEFLALLYLQHEKAIPELSPFVTYAIIVLTAFSLWLLGYLVFIFKPALGFRVLFWQWRIDTFVSLRRKRDEWDHTPHQEETQETRERDQSQN